MIDRMEPRRAQRFKEMPKIEGLPDDLQMIGQYFRMCIGEKQEEKAQSEELLRQQLMAPDDVAERDEEYLRKAGAAEEDIDEFLEDPSSSDGVRGDIAFAEKQIQTLEVLIEDLKRGEYAAPLEYLRDDVKVRQEVLEMIRQAGVGEGSPMYRERRDARIRALEGYIQLLEQKSAV